MKFSTRKVYQYDKEIRAELSMKTMTPIIGGGFPQTFMILMLFLHIYLQFLVWHVKLKM